MNLPKPQLSPNPTPTPPNWMQLVIVILFAAGGGSLGALGAAIKATSGDISAAIVYALLGMFGAFLFGSFAIVAQRKQLAIANWLERRIDELWLWITDRFEWRYFHFLRTTSKNVDLGGLPDRGDFNIEVEDVFVELSVDTETTEADSSIIPFGTLEGRFSIWQLLQNADNKHLAIIGYPGSGKTTLMRHLKFVMIDRTRRHRHGAKKLIPILLYLREHAKTLLAEQPCTLMDLVRDSLKDMPRGIRETWFESKLQQGRCLVMFDGLDEVSTREDRQHVVDWIDSQIRHYPNNRFILTSRPKGYENNPATEVNQRLTVRPFTATQQREFVKKWMLADEHKRAGNILNDEVRREAKVRAEDLLSQVRQRNDLTDMAANPLLLTMMNCLSRSGNRLPERRAAIYEDLCKLFLGKRWEAKRITLNLDPEKSLDVLQTLAFHMTSALKATAIEKGAACKAIQDVTASVGWKETPHEFLKMVELRSGLLVERESDVFAFAHKTLQEYLTALYIKEQKLEAKLIEIIKLNPLDDWWYEVIVLYCAQVDATAILEECLEFMTQDKLELAIACWREARRIDPSIREKIEYFFQQGAESPDKRISQVVCNALLQRELRDMVHIGNGKAISKHYITNAAYQAFVTEKCDRDGEHWEPYQEVNPGIRVGDLK